MKTKLFIGSFLICSSTLLAQPGSPVLTEPPDLDRVSPSTITLGWQEVNGAESYQVQACTDQNFQECAFLEATETNYVLENLSPNTSYYWHVRAFGNSVYSDWSETRSFTTASGLGPADECSLLRNYISGLGQQNISMLTIFALNVKVILARTLLLLGNNIPAANALNAFQNHVSAFINSGRLPQQTGIILNYWADYIIAAILSGNSPILEGQPVENATSYTLYQNYPNPFNPSTVISYTIPLPSDVSIKVYDLAGKLTETLIESYQDAGRYDVVWDASKYSSGTYIYILKAGSYTGSKKMLLLK
jgi:hypothetical protein